MPDTGYFALFLVGLLGGTHCVGMCGGIVSALAMGGRTGWPVLLAYNGGRLFSYALAGVIVGSLGGAGLAVADQWPLRMVLYLLANLMLVAMGFYLLGMTRVLGVLEGWGQWLWKYLQPLTRRFLPVRGITQAFPLGVLWGWLPCGLVYSALATALSSGSVERGGLLMLAFGMGTLPNLLLAGLLLAKLRNFTRRASVRMVSGILVMAFGVYGLWGMLKMIEVS